MRLIDADALIEKALVPSEKEYLEMITKNLPTIEPNLVINPEEVAEGRVIEIGEDIIVMHHKDYYDMFLKSELYDDIEPCEDAISREAAIRALDKLDDAVKCVNEYESGLSEAYYQSIKTLEKLPSVAPSIDIVRCKECKHWQDWGNGETYCCCLDGGIGSLPDDFCSYGERREP